ncbi:GyrI-like domain-containing protein [Pseudonocardia xinjiangensis]|uniref:GyrI-like domain-containing protein n=1 Tax=Pseudonocardia xinjiangensis TaxID=75289 RepID=UPI003D8E29E6
MDADTLSPDPTPQSTGTPPTGTTPALVDLPARDVLAVDGRGAPEDPSFAAAVSALFATRLALGADQDVPLEGTYSQGGSLSSADGQPFDLASPDGWVWRLLVPAPPRASEASVAAEAASSGAPVQLRRQAGQRVARLLHRGPYAAEGPSLEALSAFVAGQGLVATGPHTEIYLDDPGSTPPADLRTVLQVPVAPVR